MPSRDVTGWILVATVGALALYDVAVAANKQRGDTISEVLLDTARDHPVVPFALGVTIGHLFWPQATKERQDG